MEAKSKNSRITIKGVKEELNKEVSYLKEWVKTIENRLNISEAKVNNLEDRLSKKNNDSKDHIDKDNDHEKVEDQNNSKDEQKCKVCEKSFSSKRNFKKHKFELHTIKIDVTNANQLL